VDSSDGGSPLTTAEIESDLTSLEVSMGTTSPLVCNECGDCVSDSTNVANDYSWWNNLCQAVNTLGIGICAYYWLSTSGSIASSYYNEAILASAPYVPNTFGTEYINDITVAPSPPPSLTVTVVWNTGGSVYWQDMTASNSSGTLTTGTYPENTATLIIPYGDTVSFTGEPNTVYQTGYYFDYFSVTHSTGIAPANGATTNNPYSVQVEDNFTLAAVFGLTSYTPPPSASPTSSATAAPNGGNGGGLPNNNQTIWGISLADWLYISLGIALFIAVALIVSVIAKKK
jgi:hypothetical protein